jgi:hypothetical protein
LLLLWFFLVILMSMGSLELREFLLFVVKLNVLMTVVGEGCSFLTGLRFLGFCLTFISVTSYLIQVY